MDLINLLKPKKNANSYKTVLVVDDDDNLRNVLIDKLKTSGFETLGTASGEEGLQMALNKHPDLILLDVVMPKMTGWEMLGQLRKDEWGERVKVTMLTALESMDNVAEGIEKNVLGYLVKTNMNLDEVVKYVETALAS